MPVYTLVNAATAVQTLNNVPTIDQSNSVATGAINTIVSPPGPDANSHATPQSQAFIAYVKGTGSVSCSIQPVVSNDGINWATYGSAIACTSATAYSAASFAANNSPFAYYSGYVTAISGTSAKAYLTMST